MGSPTSVTVRDSAAINALSVKATGTFNDAPATGQVALHDVPSDLTLAAHGFGGEQGDNLPTLTYTANDGRDTLDLDIEVEAALIKHLDPGLVRADDLELHAVNLGHCTEVTVDQSSAVATITSQPRTDDLRILGNLYLQIPRVDPNFTFFNCLDLVKGLFYGHVLVNDSWIDDITVHLTDVQNVVLQPGNIRTDLPFQLPRELGYLFLVFDGTLGTATVSMAGVHLDLDIDLYLRIDKIVGPDFFQEHLKLSGLYDTVYFHRYDDQHSSVDTFELTDWGIPIAEIIVTVVPGLVEKAVNGVTVAGGQPSLITMLDPDG